MGTFDRFRHHKKKPTAESGAPRASSAEPEVPIGQGPSPRSAQREPPLPGGVPAPSSNAARLGDFASTLAATGDQSSGQTPLRDLLANGGTGERTAPNLTRSPRDLAVGVSRGDHVKRVRQWQAGGVAPREATESTMSQFPYARAQQSAVVSGSVHDASSALKQVCDRTAEQGAGAVRFFDGTGRPLGGVNLGRTSDGLMTVDLESAYAATDGVSAPALGLDALAGIQLSRPASFTFHRHVDQPAQLACPVERDQAIALVAQATVDRRAGLRPEQPVVTASLPAAPALSSLAASAPVPAVAVTASPSADPVVSALIASRDGATSYGPVRGDLFSSIMAMADRRQSGSLSLFDAAGKRLGGVVLIAGADGALGMSAVQIGTRGPSTSSEAAVRDLADLATQEPAHVTFRVGEHDPSRSAHGPVLQVIGDAARIVDERYRRVALQAEAASFGGIRSIDEEMTLSDRYPVLAAVQTMAATNRTGVLSFFDQAGVELGTVALRHQSTQRESIITDAVSDVTNDPREGVAAITRLSRTGAGATRAIFEEGRLPVHESLQHTTMGLAQVLYQPPAAGPSAAHGPQPSGTWPDDVMA